MLKKIATALLCTAAPAALFAEPVELRSADGFISVEGEIVSYDGVMLAVSTSVGVVSVPASEVACYGTGCLTAVADASLGLAPNTFTEIVIAGAPIVLLDPAPNVANPAPVVVENTPTVAPVEPALPNAPREDRLTVSFSHPSFGDLFRALAGAFAVAGQGDSRLSLTTPGQLDLSNAVRQETASVAFSEGDTQGDIQVVMAPLTGAAPFEYQSPADWSLTGPLTYQLVGLDAFAIVIAPNVGMSSLSLDELAGIYAGEITNWSELGGPDQRILPLQMPTTSQIHSDLVKLVMEPAGKTIAGNVLTLADEAGIAGSVQQFPGSISFLRLDSTGDNIVLPVRGSCGATVAAEPFNLISGDYPLVRPIMARFDTPRNTALITELFDFASKQAAQSPVAEAGFIDLQPVQQEATVNNNRLIQVLDADLSDAAKPAAAKMFELLFDAERLSPTMIGGATSGPEGAWNRAMFSSLAEELALSEYDNREVFFVGVAQSVNGDQAAIDVSVRAAEEMQAAFGQFAAAAIRASDLKLSSHGFGNVAQVACYSGQVNSDTKSQIEIWVR